jgi:hypothetical protein
LRDLEHRFPNELTIVGVHSGKFTRERETPRIRDATARLRVEHPVVNDRQFRLWRAYAVQAWPTIVVIDPSGYVVATRPGEFTAGQLAPALERLIAAAAERGTLRRAAISLTPDQPSLSSGTLRFPGKVTLDRGRVAISDSGHHRVLVGVVRDGGRAIDATGVWGDGEPGFVDGAAPRFDTPQGLAFGENVLYAADAENHAIRAIDLASGQVTTIAGTGAQVRTRSDLKRGALSSPWDLTLVDDTLFIRGRASPAPQRDAA